LNLADLGSQTSYLAAILDLAENSLNWQFLDFPGPTALPESLHVEDFTKSCFGHPV